MLPLSVEVCLCFQSYIVARIRVLKVLGLKVDFIDITLEVLGACRSHDFEFIVLVELFL